VIGRATSDLHLTPKTAAWVFAALRELRNDTEERGGFTVLVGDILDQARTVDMPTYNRLRDMVQKWPKPIHVLVGNHDQYDGTRNALEALEGGQCKVISEPTKTEIGLMVPYLPPEIFWERVRGLSDKIWWTHQGWKGAYLNNMRRDHHGLDCGRMEADLCVSGHYHAPQNLGRILYCGSPYQTTFAEEGQIKGFLAWDGDMRPLRVPFELVDAPRHWTVDWRPGEEAELPEGWKAGDKVRVRTTATRDEVKKAKIMTGGLAGASIVAQPTRADRLTIEASTPVEAVREFIRQNYTHDMTRVDPAVLDEWAKEAKLWD
jgi:DNA repair exonuclease SbcCD nuclease subunit